MRFRMAVVGATGPIGREILSILAERDVSVGDVVALESTAPKGMDASYGDDDSLKVVSLDGFDFATVDVALFASDAMSTYASRAMAQGCVVVDRSIHHRLGRQVSLPEIPLIVPEVNADILACYGHQGLVASPRAATTHLALCLAPLHRAVPVIRAVVCSYQSVASMGKRGMDELFRQTRGIYVNESPADSKEVFPKQIAFNVIPQVDSFHKDGATGEEDAIAAELRTVVDPEVQVHVNCAVVPTFIGSGYFVTVEFEDALSERDARAVLKEAPGVSVVDHRVDEGYVTPAEVPGEDPVFVSRVRRDVTVAHGLSFWVTGDTLRKGTALNAVQIVELLRDNTLRDASR